MHLPDLVTHKLYNACELGRMRMAMFSVVMVTKTKAKHVFITPK